MFIPYTDIRLNVESYIRKPGSKNCLFFIHGFTGSAIEWDPIASEINEEWNIYLIDLPGHGKSDSPVELFHYTQESIINQIKEIVSSVGKDKAVLAGYSMGGRAALSFAVHNPNLLKGLVLESATAGIKDPMLRSERIKKDSALTEFISEKSLEEFIDYWMNIDIFNTQRRFSKDKLMKIREQKLENTKTGLINSLLGFGTGSMTPLYDLLNEFDIQTLLLTGELDSKFTDLNRELVTYIPKARHRIIKNAGHNTHLEEPKKFIRKVNKFLNELETT